MIYQEKLSSFKWLALILLSPAFVLFYATELNFEKLDARFYITAGCLIFFVLISLLLIFQYLKVTFYTDFLEVSYWPYNFFGACRRIDYSEITGWEILNIDPIYEFGGVGGVRKSKTYGVGYVADTSEFLFLELKSGNRFTFNVRDKGRVVEIMHQKVGLE